MQIGAINSVNFKGVQKADSEMVKSGKPEYLKDKTIDVDYLNLSSDDETDSFDEVSADEFVDGLNKFKQDVKNAKQNVHPLTCLAGTVAALCALTKGSKAIAWTRSAAALAGGTAAKGVVKAASKVVKSIDTEKATGKINGLVARLSEKSNVNNPKIEEAVVNTVDTVFSRTVNGVPEKKGNAFVKVLNKFGIYLNAPSLFDVGVATIGAYKAADIISDGSEASLDSFAISESAKKNFGKEFAAEVFNVIAS